MPLARAARGLLAAGLGTVFGRAAFTLFPFEGVRAGLAVAGAWAVSAVWAESGVWVMAVLG